MSSQISKAENLLHTERMREFEPGWNGNGGITFSDEVLSLYKEIIEALPEDKQPSVHPTGRGSIGLIFRREEEYLDFEVFALKAESIWLKDRMYQCPVSHDKFEGYPKDFVLERVGKFYEKES